MITLQKWARARYQPCLTLGDNNSSITGCERHIQLSREAACEGTVLLKNENQLLPLKKGQKVAIFGKAQIDYVRCGGGSGNVYSKYVRNIYEGLKLKADKVQVFDKLSLFYEAAVLSDYEKGEKNGKLTEIEIPQQLLEEAKLFTDTAIITICRYSSESRDSRNDGEDAYFMLSKQEKAMVEMVCDNFEKVIVLLNTGAMIDTSWFADNDRIQASLMIWQGGMEGGLATADILVGDVTPSGKLVDTCARNFDDYPSSEGFHESEDYVKYTEDIFVGYRYFETIPGKKDCVVYPFGYGLSYTTFTFSDIAVCPMNGNLYVSVKVKNTGKYEGKEVVQVYYSAPKGKITKSAIELCAFAKTKLLQPGEEQVMFLSFDIKDMASYDDIGDVCKSAYVLEKGTYKIFVGNSVRNVKEAEYKYELSEDTIVEQLTQYCTPENLGKRLTATGEYAPVPDEKQKRKEFPCDYVCEEKIPEKPEDIKYLIDVVNGELTLDEFITQLSDEEMMNLLHGQKSTGVATTDGMGNLEKYGIPAPMTTDGPAGVRLRTYKGIGTTAFPVATMLACTWNTDILERVGAAGALETKENNMSIWLTPALNIHRSPLCGRNFEYYSEDPYVAGKMAAAMVSGIQSQGIVATPKHFACNNKETNRHLSDSIVSERAMREIYLRGFEICVKEASPKLIMSSYNILNGVRVSENAELLTGILRGEWGYRGLVTSDWENRSSMCAEVIAGNDIHMPSHSTFDIKEKYAEGKITRNQLAVSVKRLLNMIMWIE